MHIQSYARNTRNAQTPRVCAQKLLLHAHSLTPREQQSVKACGDYGVLELAHVRICSNLLGIVFSIKGLVGMRVARALGEGVPRCRRSRAMRGHIQNTPPTSIIVFDFVQKVFPGYRLSI